MILIPPWDAPLARAWVLVVLFLTFAIWRSLGDEAEP